MKWLHLSDIHFNLKGDEADSLLLREQLLNYLADNSIKVDKLFITGDFRDAARQTGTEEEARNVSDFILKLASIIGVKNKDILLTPGNHDLTRDYCNRQKVIKENKKNYTSSNGFFTELDTLIDSFEFYKKIVINIYGQNHADKLFDSIFKINPHIYQDMDEIGVLLLNTELLAGELIEDDRVIDEGTLFAGTKYLIHSLYQTEYKNKPILALGHRGFDFFNHEEKRKILNIFANYNVCVYLCGHSHDLWYEKINDLPQITIGCIRKQENVTASFLLGEYCGSSNQITIEAFSWGNNCWGKYMNFNNNSNKLIIDFARSTYLRNNNTCNIKIVIDGFLRDFCGQPISMTHYTRDDIFMSTIDGELIFEIIKNEYTHYIKRGHRFYLSGDIWEIIGFDDTNRKKIIITCKKDLFNPKTDDDKNFIANANNLIT